MKELKLFTFDNMCIWAYTEEQAQLLYINLKAKTNERFNYPPKR